jgi:hypothetical protein
VASVVVFRLYYKETQRGEVKQMAITIDQLEVCAEECRRFQRKISRAFVRLKYDGKGIYDQSITGTPETGAVRRASMDLTRELARLRRPR